MRRIPGLRLTLVGLAALVAGCADQPLGTYDQPRYQVQAAARAEHDLVFRPGSPRLVPGEEERLGGFLGGLAAGGVEDVVMTFVTSGSTVLDRDRVAEATRAARRSGPPLRLHVVATRDRERADDRADIVVFEPLSRGQLLVACPPRYADAYEESLAARIPPIGCANAANLAHMAADRRDLVAPRRLGPGSGAVEAAAVDRYRTGRITMPPPLETRN